MKREKKIRVLLHYAYPSTLATASASLSSSTSLDLPSTAILRAYSSSRLFWLRLLATHASSAPHSPFMACVGRDQTERTTRDPAHHPSGLTHGRRLATVPAAAAVAGRSSGGRMCSPCARDEIPADIAAPRPATAARGGGEGGRPARVKKGRRRRWRFVNLPRIATVAVVLTASAVAM